MYEYDLILFSWPTPYPEKNTEQMRAEPVCSRDEHTTEKFGQGIPFRASDAGKGSELVA